MVDPRNALDSFVAVPAYHQHKTNRLDWLKRKLDSQLQQFQATGEVGFHILMTQVAFLCDHHHRNVKTLVSAADAREILLVKALGLDTKLTKKLIEDLCEECKGYLRNEDYEALFTFVELLGLDKLCPDEPLFSANMLRKMRPLSLVV